MSDLTSLAAPLKKWLRGISPNDSDDTVEIMAGYTRAVRDEARSRVEAEYAPLVDAARDSLSMLGMYVEIYGVIDTKDRPNEAGEIIEALRAALSKE